MNPAVQIELHYLPCIAYFSAIRNSDVLIIEKHEHFIKQTFRNRCRIVTSQGTMDLSIPVKARHGKLLITHVEIDYDQRWLNNHWRAIVSSYRNAPYFEYYADDLERILFRQHRYLYDLNFELLTICLAWLRTKKTIKESMSYEKELPVSVLDLRNRINAKKPECYKNYFRPEPYTQVFGNGFAANASLIDLIFCTGPRAGSIVGASNPAP